MKRVRLNKISSATHRVGIQKQALLTDQIIAEEGYIVAVRVMDRNDRYNKFEIVGGRLTTVYPGDIIAGVLGVRNALHGHAGDIPKSIKVGDQLHLLNMGGVIGRCYSSNPSLGSPIKVEVLGAVLSFPIVDSREGIPANIRMGALPIPETLTVPQPVIMISGTSMNSGKTFAACEVVRVLSKQGLNTVVGKLTGVALQRDVLSMVDCGAKEALSFADVGFPSTNQDTAPLAAHAVLHSLAQHDTHKPDVIIAELGDGLLGPYGVHSILKNSGIRALKLIHIVCATDPVGVSGAQHIFSQLAMPITAFSGPVTDHAVGCSFIQSSTGSSAFNALTQGEQLGAEILRSIHFKN